MGLHTALQSQRRTCDLTVRDRVLLVRSWALTSARSGAGELPGCRVLVSVADSLNDAWLRGRSRRRPAAHR
jgi:hypothetical protein